jgi:hypothetical protein
MSSQAEFVTPSPIAKPEKRHSASEHLTPDPPKKRKPNETENLTPTAQQGPIIPTTPCTPRTLASFDLEKSQANSILSRTHTITSLGHLLEFAAEWAAINGRPTNSTEYGVLLKAFEKTDVIYLILHKIDIFVARQAQLFNPQWKRLAGHVGGEQIKGRWPLPCSRQCPRRHNGRYSVRHCRSPCTDLHC